MSTKERLQQVLERELGITTVEQLNDAYDRLDTSIFGIFIAEVGENDEKMGNVADDGNSVHVCTA